jgi:hypothetical protein
MEGPLRNGKSSMTRAKLQMTSAEALPYAEKIADCILYSWDAELAHSMAEIWIKRPESIFPFAKMFGLDLGAQDIPIYRALGFAVDSRNRDEIINWFVSQIRIWPKEGIQDFVATMHTLPAVVRAHGAKGLQRIKLRRGAVSRIKPDEYSKLAALGDQLTPAVASILTEHESYASHSIRATIEYRQPDFPKECDFLLKHLNRLESILKNKPLLSRAKKRSTRSRLIADAMAGAEFKLEPRTSLERAREGRRKAQKKTS